MIQSNAAMSSYDPMDISSDESQMNSMDERENARRFQSEDGMLEKRFLEVRYEKWPYALGLVIALDGVFTFVMSTLSIVLLPILADDTGKHGPIYLGRDNAYGLTLLMGLMFVITGCTGVRASFTRRVSTVFRFFSLICASVVISISVFVLLVYGYSSGWFSPKAPSGEGAYMAHSFATFGVIMGLCLSIAALVHYYNDVFCGEIMSFLRRLFRSFPCCKTVSRSGRFANEENGE